MNRYVKGHGNLFPFLSNQSKRLIRLTWIFFFDFCILPFRYWGRVWKLPLWEHPGYCC